PKSFDFGDASPKLVNDSIDVTDTNGKSWTFTTSDSKSYDETYTDPDGTCTSHKNTATITTDGASDSPSDSVTVQDCQGGDLTVSKTAAPSFKRTYKWDITKKADAYKVYSAGGGESGAVNYTVSVTHDSGTDSDWAVKGTITITNPNDWQDVTLTDLADALD